MEREGIRSAGISSRSSRVGGFELEADGVCVCVRGGVVLVLEGWGERRVGVGVGGGDGDLLRH